MSVLHIREIWQDGRRTSYSYYWLKPDGDLVEGWDNAPHHPEIETFPDHAHTKGGVKPLHRPDLKLFLDKIRKALLCL